MEQSGTDHEELSRAVEAADRAGSIVTDHVRSIIDAAESRAAEIERNAQQEATKIRDQALDAATKVLSRIDSVEDRLGTLVSGLRKEVDDLSAGLDRRS